MSASIPSLFRTFVIAASLVAASASLAQVVPAGAPSAAPRGPGAPERSPAAPPAQVAPEPSAPAPAPDETNELPSLPATPAPISELIAARPFTAETPWPTDWREDRAPVREGWIVLLRVPHEFVVPRQTQEPILYAGATTVERLGNFIEEGVVLAIVPATPRSNAVPGHGAESAEGMRPLAQIAFWYGTPGLPEQVGVTDISREVASAEKAGIRPRSAAEVARALERGGVALKVADRAELLESAALMGPRPSATERVE